MEARVKRIMLFVCLFACMCSFTEEQNANEIPLIQRIRQAKGYYTAETMMLAKSNPMIYSDFIAEIKSGAITQPNGALDLISKCYPFTSEHDQKVICNFLLESDKNIKEIGFRKLSRNPWAQRIYLKHSYEKKLINELENYITDAKPDLGWSTTAILVAKAQVPGAKSIFRKMIGNIKITNQRDYITSQNLDSIVKLKSAHIGNAILGDADSIDFIFERAEKIDSISDWSEILAQIRNKKIPIKLMTLFDDSIPDVLPSESHSDAIIVPYNVTIRDALMKFFPEMAEELGVKYAEQLTNDQVRQWVKTVGIPYLEKETKGNSH